MTRALRTIKARRALRRAFRLAFKFFQSASRSALEGWSRSRRPISYSYSTRPDAELHLVEGEAVVVVELDADAGGVGLADAGVAEGGGLGRGLAYGAAAGLAGGRAAVEGLARGLDDFAAEGVDLVVELGVVGDELQLVDVAAVVAVELGLGPDGVRYSGVAEGGGLGRGFADVVAAGGRVGGDGVLG